jgi:hypothetical protein
LKYTRCIRRAKHVSDASILTVHAPHWSVMYVGGTHVVASKPCTVHSCTELIKSSWHDSTDLLATLSFCSKHRFPAQQDEHTACHSALRIRILHLLLSPPSNPEAISRLPIASCAGCTACKRAAACAARSMLEQDVVVLPCAVVQCDFMHSSGGKFLSVSKPSAQMVMANVTSGAFSCSGTP